MAKITFMGAGSTIFSRRVLCDCLCSDVLKDSEFALYDIDPKRLSEVEAVLKATNEAHGGCATINAFLGVANRKSALSGADFVINAIQVADMTPARSLILKFRKSTVFVRPLPIPSASAVLCGHFAPFR